MSELSCDHMTVSSLDAVEMVSINGGLSFGDTLWAYGSAAAFEVEKFFSGFGPGFDKSYTITKG